MKKIVSTFLFMASIASSATAIAAAEAGPLNNTNTIGPTGSTGSTHTCSLLGSQVQINLSSNVEAAFNCNFATSTIRVGTCHTAGSRAPRTATCTSTTTDGVTTWAPEGCSATVQSVTLTDRVAFTASSQGGSVGAADLAGAACTDASVAGLITQ